MINVTPTSSSALKALLQQQLSNGWRGNLAMRELVGDYARHHVVVVVAAGCVALLLLALSVGLLRRFRNARATDKQATRVELGLYLSLGVFSAFLVLLFASLAVLDGTDAFSPLHGFAGVVQQLPAPHTAADNQLAGAYQTWITSGSAPRPVLIQQSVHDRLTWQAPKAAISGILTGCFALLSLIVFRAAIRSSRRRTSPRTTAALTVSGSAALAFAFVAIVLFGANLAGSLAPLALTLSSL